MHGSGRSILLTWIRILAMHYKKNIGIIEMYKYLTVHWWFGEKVIYCTVLNHRNFNDKWLSLHPINEYSMKFKFVPFFLSVQTYSKMYRNIFIKTKKLRSTNVFIIIFINFVITIAIFLGRKMSQITGENKFSKLAKKLRSRTKCKLSQGSIQSTRIVFR